MKKRFLTACGIKIETAWFGPRPDKAVTLVFLHEGLGCVDMWKDFPQRLADTTGCSAFVYSRPGYGGSAPLPLPWGPYFMHRHAKELLPAILKAAGIGEYILVGHSDGGSIALIYSGNNPGSGLRGVIAEAAHVYTEEFNLASIRRARDNYIDGDLRKKLAKYHKKNVDNAFWGWNGAWLDPAFKDFNIISSLKKITVPLQVIQGRDDPYGTIDQVTSIIYNTRSLCEAQVLPGCGHSPHLEMKPETLEIMASFVNRCRNAGRF